VLQLLERQRSPRRAPATFDAVAAVAARRHGGNAQVFQVRDGVLSTARSFIPDNQAEQEAAIVAEEFLLQYYPSALAIRR
jgi:excinuclease ABC subunit C